ncbi:hypothetical protein [Brevundimonas sp.]|jgi:hypothetical protein|uniref:hypothetical protein n=1 Tax=Brevundimonas sp. TaxID=1871086 RepID=UPI00391B9372
MATTSKITQALLGPAFALGAMTVANDADAQALQGRQCVSLAEFNQTLAAEGQRTLVMGERITVANDPSSSTGVRTSRRFNGISSNAEGSIGYQYEGDMPRGMPSTRICIGAVLTNVGLYDARRTEIPARAYLGGRFNQVVDNRAAEGNRPMIIADTVFGSGTTRRNGLPIVVFGDLTDRLGSVSTLLPNGDPTSIVSLDNVDYTPAAIERISSQR